MSAIPQITCNRPSVLVTANRNLTLTDRQRHLYSTSSSNFTLTIPQDTFATDDEIEIAADSTGTLSIAISGTVTINGAATTVACGAGKGGFLKFRSPNVVRWFGG